ncbi:Integrase, catalytic region, putative [Theobroma cacao]|uniref:Integrase, catalytic region, putative n=1 Tax=Theobroma cacao TaxID=3641 RepID=A0A061GZP5_THECC|nr:Integrase, catalytic region, putative [Theobroma cacao]
MDSAMDAWNVLKQNYAQPDDTRVCNLQFTLGNVTQGTQSVDTYFVELKGIWEEFRNYRPLPSCQYENCNPECFKKYTDQYKKDMVFRFLNGLNDSFSAVRSQIILMDPIPTLDKVYSLMLREEAQRNILFQTQPMLELSAMLAAANTKKKKTGRT